jgi:hypothetical protein
MHCYLICETPLQQIKALLQSVGSSFCPNFSDWFGVESGDSHSKNADRSVVSKFLQAHPSDFSTTKLQVRPFNIIIKCCFIINFHALKIMQSFGTLLTAIMVCELIELFCGANIVLKSCIWYWFLKL